MAIRDWLAAFSNDVVEVKEPVATDLEATRFLLRHPRQPVHLRNLQGGEAVGNLWSTRDRVAAALRVSNADLLPKLMDAQAHPKDARVVARADFMRHETTDVDLRELPIPKLFPKDAGRYIPAGVWVAEAEYVLEGRLIHEVHEEGPFVDAVRTYDRVRKEPILVVDRIYHRENPIFHIIVGGLDEHFMFMGMPREPVIYQAVSRAVPHVKAVRLTEGGCAWLHGVVSIRKQHQGDGKNAILAAFGAHTSMKQVVIVDEDIDVFDDRDVEWAIATRFQADRGLVVLHDVRGSSIDPSARDGFTSKMGIDATKPLAADPAMFDKATL